MTPFPSAQREPSATLCNTLQHTATRCTHTATSLVDQDSFAFRLSLSTLQHTASNNTLLQCNTLHTHCNKSSRPRLLCLPPQPLYTATHCIKQHTATTHASASLCNCSLSCSCILSSTCSLYSQPRVHSLVLSKWRQNKALYAVTTKCCNLFLVRADTRSAV